MLPRAQGQNYNTWKGFAQQGNFWAKAAAHSADWVQRAATIFGVPVLGGAAERATGIIDDEPEDEP